ncbi:uncharacterized protein LAESUDRAFT_653321 [Laetiporus sulphureus 93-53]|uniref:DnaJ homologue subfamily C member 28 conserved domain-containing protein n=1 Tax=Laetiporus sulphureus 93-53 TaxID=1314785 RepID=A0A165E8A9_9APHY|nr:uncharacterized protein LAESUDRAFT_653321 [Laetiporus sulphureus 93-53]KZT06443.1 hypothetical protein LAESUDRAFT_653321 [Laetiporus sulphureus 93-53]
MSFARPALPLYISFSASRTVVSSVRRRNLNWNAVRREEADHRASSKLFEDAAREEAEERKHPPCPSQVSILEGQNENWTGEESIQDAVLRMLVDKYKPLRSGPIRTADEKLKQDLPKVSAPDTITGLTSDISAGELAANINASSNTAQDAPRRYLPGEPLLPSIEGHKPWHTTFKVPSHATSNVRHGHFPSPSPKAAPSPVLDEKAKRKERETRRRTEQAGRLSRAKESTLDYRLGIKGDAAVQRRVNPITLKGWASLVEDRIESARQEGLFRNVKGRGQPLESTTQDSNPFIAREEFLMNRIVQRQGAAPPWVEVQGEMELAVTSFRTVLKQSWTRRAIRMLTLQPTDLLPKLTLDDVIALRDAEWEAREQAFHETALEEVNALVRKYNGLAPYAVRKGYYSRSAELDKAYRDSAEDILQGLAERMSSVNKSGRFSGVTDGWEDDDRATEPPGVTSSVSRWTLRDLLRDWWTSFRGR